MDNIKTGNLIKENRKEKGLTQKQLADLLHITDRAVSKWERGLSAPDIALLEPLAEILDVTVAEIVCGQKENEVTKMPVEDTVKNIIDYSEKQIEKKTNEAVTKNTFAYYAVVINLLMAAELFISFLMKRLSRYAGYEILGVGHAFGSCFGWSSILVFGALVGLSPLWFVLGMMQWATADKKNIFTRAIDIALHIIGIPLVMYMSYAVVKEGAQVKTRYAHLVTMGTQRYEMAEITGFPRTYEYDTGRYLNSITYIYDEENLDKKTEEYLNDVISRQPLKIYKLEKKKADHAMWQYHIKELPAVVIMYQGNMEVITGYDEIALFEAKIHNYKQNNMYFY